MCGSNRLVRKLSGLRMPKPKMMFGKGHTSMDLQCEVGHYEWTGFKKILACGIQRS